MPATFRSWLNAQSNRPDQVGELARRWDADKTHGSLSSALSIKAHITGHWPAEDGVNWANVLDQAASERLAAETGQPVHDGHQGENPTEYVQPSEPNSAGSTENTPDQADYEDTGPAVFGDALLVQIARNTEWIMDVLRAGLPEAAIAVDALREAGDAFAQVSGFSAEPPWQELVAVADFGAAGEGDDHE